MIYLRFDGSHIFLIKQSTLNFLYLYWFSCHLIIWGYKLIQINIDWSAYSIIYNVCFYMTHDLLFICCFSNWFWTTHYSVSEFVFANIRANSSRPSQSCRRHFFIQWAVTILDTFLMVLFLLSLRATNMVFPNFLLYFLRNSLYFIKEKLREVNFVICERIWYTSIVVSELDLFAYAIFSMLKTFS